MLKIAIGPARPLPTWRWVGLAAAQALAGSFEVATFESFRALPPCDALLAIKQPPSARIAARLSAQGIKLAYAPIDHYVSHAQIHADRHLLQACDLVLCHDALLLQCLRPYCRRILPVEHHGRYSLPAGAAYRTDGYVLWVGGFEHAPHLLDWLRRHPVGREIKLLTDWRNPNARVAAWRLAADLDLPLALNAGSLNGHEIRQWSEPEQRRMLEECKAAIDIKGGDFSQATKPPTKAQKFISSGIPFACNAESTATRYFRSLAFDVACPLDEARWFSPGYWRETAAVAAALRPRISFEAVGDCYRAAVLSLWQGQAS